jgi:arsenate reductase (glutaredoxin)
VSILRVVIHYNPDCGTSRNVLEFIRAAGYEPTVIDDLTEGWTRPQRLALFAAAGTTVRESRVHRPKKWDHGVRLPQ